MSLPNITGRVAWVFTEEDFDVDQIIGVKNIKISDIDELAGLAMQAYDPDFKSVVRVGDVLVGGRNFGYGHPHYPPLRAMRHLGIKALIAESFSPGFWRGEISMGFPLVSCPGIVESVQRWDEVKVDWQRSRLVNHRSGSELEFAPLSLADRGMVEQGGLIGYLKQRDRASASG